MYTATEGDRVHGRLPASTHGTQGALNTYIIYMYIYVYMYMDIYLIMQI